jgi:hypothetical protein
VPFQVDPMLIPMFGRGNLSKKFSTGGKVLQGIAKGAKTAQEAVSKKTREFPGVLAPQVGSRSWSNGSRACQDATQRIVRRANGIARVLQAKVS